MKNMVMYRAGEHSWVTYIKARIKGNLNFIGLAEGQTGAGKSWAMMSIAQMIDPDFTVDQVAFSFRELMNIMNADWFKKKSYKVIIFDEAQTDINNRAWQSLTNKLMLYLTSTFRHQNIILLFTSPYADFMDSATMKLVHAKFNIRGHNRTKRVTNCKPLLQQYNGKMKKFYQHSLHVSSKKGVMKISNWEIPRPTKDLIDPYEDKKTAFTSALNLDIQRQLDEAFAKTQPKKEEEKTTEREWLDKNRKPLTLKQQEAVLLYEQHQSVEKVSKIIGCSISTVSGHLKGARKKGYEVKMRGMA